MAQTTGVLNRTISDLRDQINHLTADNEDLLKSLATLKKRADTDAIALKKMTDALNRVADL